MPRCSLRRAAIVSSLAALLFVSRANASPGDGDDFDMGSDEGSSSSSSDDNSSSTSSNDSPGLSNDSSWGWGGDGGGRHGDTGPIVVVALAMVLGLGVALVLALQKKSSFWSTVSSNAPHIPPTNARRDLEALRTEDANFSAILFEDFVYSLYGAVQLARGRGDLAGLSAYVDPALARAIGTSDGSLLEVRTVVIGAMEVCSVEVLAARVDVAIEMIANFTELRRDMPAQSFVVRERWTLSRKRGVLTKPPAEASLARCPNCGNPNEAMRDGHCAHCGRAVATGEFDWVVSAITVLKKEPRRLQLVAGNPPARGTDRPTLVDPDLARAVTEFRARHPSFDYARFLARVGVVFSELQIGWQGKTPERLRPYVSDALFHKLADQIETYRVLGMTNRLDGAHITRVELARVTSDRWIDGITVRLFVDGLDYRVRDADGAVVSGDARVPKPYTEYWTMIRGTAASGSKTGDDRVCPSCGAALQINMAGVCPFCSAKVTSGAFDWVLSRIEQDKAYRG